MSTLELKELSHPAGEVIKIAAGKTLDLKTQGSVTMPTGSVLQVVHATSTTEVASTSTAYVHYSSSDATITPTSTSSKILVLMESNSAPYNDSSNDAKQYEQIFRGSTGISKELEIRGYDYGGSGSNVAGSAVINHLDSPNTTSSTTYSLRFRFVAGTNARIKSCSITLMEIQG
jgi:hypothetical protein